MTQSSRPWWNAIRSGRGGARCWSTSTTCRRWAPSRSGLLDAVGAPTRSLLTRIVRGIARASEAWRVPVLGGHTQLGVPAALAVTAFGRTVGSDPRRRGIGRRRPPSDRRPVGRLAAGSARQAMGFESAVAAPTNSPSCRRWWRGWRRGRPRTSAWPASSAPRECWPRPADRRRPRRRTVFQGLPGHDG